MWAPSEALAALQREYRKGSVVESFRLAEKILSTETPSASDVERSAALKIRGWAKTFLDDFRGAIKDLEEAAALSPHLKKQTGGTKVLLSALKRAVNTKLRIQRAARDHWSVIAPDEARKCSEESSAWNRADFRMEWYRRTVLRRSSERKAELRNPPDTPDVLDNKEPWGGAEFRGCISRSLRCPIPHFPYGQATNGVLFEKLDSLDLKWDKDARALDPVPHAEFPFPVCPPCANSVKVETPREGLDLFVSPKAVDECSLDLLRKWFDLRAEETQDFPVPQYHNLLDPNLSVHLAALPGGGLPFKPGELSGGRQRGRMENWQGDPRAWRWTPTDVLVEAHPVETEQIVYLLQLKALRSKSCGNKMFGEAVVRRVLDFWRDWEAKEQKEFVLTARLCGPLAGCGEGLRMFGEEETVDASGHRVERKGDFDALFHSLVERILRSAAPLLAQLRRPALLLPGPLQVVCKAQRIFVKEGEEYEGVWHLDGEAERVVAVGILYLRMSPSLEGGALEFFDKGPVQDAFWLWGDCTPEDGSPESLRKDLEVHGRAKVPVKRGSLVVFSNYQLLHRVLRMRLRAPKEKSKGDKGKEVPAAAAAASSSSSPVATQAGEEKDSDVVSPFTGESNKAAGETEQSPSSSAAAEKSPLESSQPQRPSDRVGMRDFLVFFFLDQRYPLVSTTDLRFCLKPAGKKTDEAPPAAAAAAAAASSSSSSPASDRSNLVVLQNTAERVGKRGELLRSQLEPKPLVSSPHQGGSRGDGERGNASAVNPLTSLSATDAAALSRRKSKLTATFGLPDQGVSSTGNGSVAQLAFQFGSSLGRLDSFDQQMDSEIVTDGMDCIRKVNICPPLNHGSSWAWDANRGVWDEPNPSSTWVEERYFGDEGLREGPRGYVSRYRNINSGLVTRKPPIEGCFSVDEYTGGEEIPRSDGSESEESSSDDE